VRGHAPRHVLRSGFASFFLSSCIMPVQASTRAPVTVPASRRCLASSFASCVPDLLALSFSCCFSLVYYTLTIAHRYFPPCLCRWPSRSSIFLLAVFSSFFTLDPPCGPVPAGSRHPPCSTYHRCHPCCSVEWPTVFPTPTPSPSPSS
jgi:hypothetical protein